MLPNMIEGLHLFMSWTNIVAMVIGVAVGIIIGAIPGLTVLMAISLAIPITFFLPPIESIVLLLGIYVGGIFGGSISAILINTPGTPSGAATCLDGYPLAQQGSAGKAIKAALYSSIFGDVFSAILLIFIAERLSRFALRFGPAEYFSLILFSLTIIASVSGKNLTKGLIAGSVGIFLSTVGSDEVSGTARLTFGSIHLSGGISIVPMLLGLFAISEMLQQVRKADRTAGTNSLNGANIDLKGEKNRFTFNEFFRQKWLLLCSASIGSFIGSLPGIGSVTAAFLSYAAAQRMSKDPSRFGKGAIEGVCAAECANNAVTGGALIPLLALGIPGDAVTAVLLGALMIQNLIPGPLLFVQNGHVMYAIFIGLIASNLVMFLAITLGMRLFVKITQIPNYFLLPSIMAMCVIGSFAVNNNMFDVVVMLFFGVVGYLMVRNGIPLVPLIIAFILGPMLENSLGQALLMSDGSVRIFLSSWLSIFFLVLTALSIIGISISQHRARNSSVNSGHRGAHQ